MKRRPGRGLGPWQTSASDPVQVKAAGKIERRARDEQLEDVRQVVASPAARRFLWRLLKYCKVHETIYPVLGPDDFEDPVLRLAHNAGRQDVGHWIEVELAEAQDEVLLLMMREAKDQERSQADEAEAQRTPSRAATEQPEPGEEA